MSKYRTISRACRAACTVVVVAAAFAAPCSAAALESFATAPAITVFEAKQRGCSAAIEASPQGGAGSALKVAWDATHGSLFELYYASDVAIPQSAGRADGAVRLKVLSAAAGAVSGVAVRVKNARGEIFHFQTNLNLPANTWTDVLVSVRQGLQKGSWGGDKSGQLDGPLLLTGYGLLVAKDAPAGAAWIRDVSWEPAAASAAPSTSPAVQVSNLAELVGKYELGNADLLTPFWQSRTVKGETVLFVQEHEGESADGTLLFRPGRILHVRNARDGTEYEAGRDFTVDAAGRRLVLTKDSRIAFLKRADFYKQKDEKRAIRAKAGDPNTWLLYAETWFQGQQVEVEYVRDEDWSGYVPRYAGGELKTVVEKLKQKQTIRLVITGDSISAGANASWKGWSPHMPPYAVLLAAGLEKAHGGKVELVRLAVPGATADGGLAHIQEVVTAQPDLVIIAYGMNDVAGRNPTAYARNIRSMMEAVRRSSPAASFILVASSRANPEWSWTPAEEFPKYRDALAQLCGPQAVLADMTSLWSQMLERKRYHDLTGNGVNHPNDFGHRLMAQVLMAMLVNSGSAGAVTAPAAAPGRHLEPSNIESFFVTPGEPAVLSWKTEPAAAGEVPCVVSDYWGRPVGGKFTATADASGKVTLPVTLPRGFYQVSFPAGGEQFGVMAIAVHEGKADAFFGIDSVLSWLEKRPAAREGLIGILQRSGVGISRDRVSWSHINPAPGKWDWNAVNEYERLREMYGRHSMPILEMFHDAPAWVRPGTAPGRYPIDLVQTARSWQTIAGRWQRYWGGLEIWNEPEGTYGGGWPPEQYIPTIKAIAGALAATKVPLGGGVFMGEDPGDFHRTCALNGMLDHVDFIGFHTYHGAADIQRHVGAYRDWLRGYGKESMPLWITESGEPWPAGTDRAGQNDDAKSALEVTMKAVESRACGVARYFPFDYPFYVEGDRNFSMMGKELTPLRSMAAYVQCIAALSGRSYVGDLVTDAPVRLARVFGGAGQQIVVLYTGKPAADAAIRLEVPVQRIEGIDGRSLALTPDGQIPIPDGMVYVRVAAETIRARLKTDTPAARLYAMAQQSPPSRPAPSPLVLQLDKDSLAAMHGPDGYLVQATAARQLSPRVRVWNLSDQATTVKLVLKQPGDGASSQAASPTPVPAQGSAEVSWSVDALASLDIEQYRYLTVSDVSGAAPAVSPLAISLRLEGTLPQHLARHKLKLPLPIGEMSRWEKNIAPSGQMSFSSPAAGQWKMELSFPRKTDQWVYPKFRLDKGIDARSAQGVIVRARAAEAADVRLMLFRKGVAAWWTSQPIIPADGQWHVAWIPAGRFDPLTDINDVGRLNLSEVDQISVGLHNRSASNANVLEVSDLVLVGGE